jgi:hypothetical protein
VRVPENPTPFLQSGGSPELGLLFRGSQQIRPLLSWLL